MTTLLSIAIVALAIEAGIINISIKSLKQQIEQLSLLYEEIEELKSQVKKYMPVEDFLTNLENEVQRQKQLTKETNNDKD